MEPDKSEICVHCRKPIKKSLVDSTGTGRVHVLSADYEKCGHFAEAAPVDSPSQGVQLKTSLAQPWEHHAYLPPDEFHGRWGCKICSYSEDMHAPASRQPGVGERLENEESMICTKCGDPIEKGQPYSRTKRGSHHHECGVKNLPEIGTEVEKVQREWFTKGLHEGLRQARTIPPVVPSEAAPETKMVCPYDKQQCEYPRCLGGNDVYADPLCKNNLATCQLPATEVKLSWPSSTCVECGKEIPSGIIQRCMFGGPCNHHAPNAILAQLVAAREEIARLEEKVSGLRGGYDRTSQEAHDAGLALATLRDSHDALLSLAKRWQLYTHQVHCPSPEVDEAIARAEALKGKP